MERASTIDLRARRGLRAHLVRLLVSALLVVGLPAVAGAQEAPAQRDDSGFSVRGSVGFAADPSMFLMTLEVPWQADELVSVGPLFQLGFSDDDTYFAPTLEAYITPRLGGDLDEIRPYAHMGLGFAYLEKDHRSRDRHDVDFQFTGGAGVEYALQKSFFVGTGLLFNVIPAGAVGEKFIFGWQVLSFRLAF